MSFLESKRPLLAATGGKLVAAAAVNLNRQDAENTAVALSAGAAAKRAAAQTPGERRTA
jgi:hypothetical protein